MGCHTWFYKEAEEVSYDEAKIYLIKLFNKKMECFKNYINNPLDEEYLDILEDLPHWTIEYMQNNVAIWERQQRMVEGGYCKEAVMNKFERESKLMMYRNGKHYENSEYHDLFRKNGYPVDKLYSYQETLDYISNIDNKCTVYDYTMEYLKLFWEKYPNGFIEFG